MTTAIGHTLFDTAIGRCGVAWAPAGIVAVQLPEASPEATRARLLRKARGAPEAVPPPAVRRAIDEMTALLEGARHDLAWVPLDLDGVPPFERRVYEAIRLVGPGSTITYGELAARLGEPGAAQAVGQALGRNPFPIVVPCHRVLAAGQRSGGFSGGAGVPTKLRMLEIEGALAADALPLFR